MSRVITPFPVRLPAELRAKLEEEADREGKSLNTVIVQKLEASYPAIEQEMLGRRMSEIHELRRHIDVAEAEYEMFLKRKAGKDFGKLDEQSLEEVITRKRQELATFRMLLSVAQRDIDTLTGEKPKR
jgi:molybdopterin converting factor small subunit